MAWMLVVVAGLFETAWVVGLKYSDGFTKLWPSLLTAAALAVSMFLLSHAARTLPIGTAYAVWVGIGAAGAALVGIAVFHEPATAPRLFFLAMLVAAIIGLKATAT